MPLMSLEEAKVIAKGHAARRFAMTAPDAKAVKERTGLLQGDYPDHFLTRIDFGVPDFSPHGRRGAAATLLREHGFGRDVVELLLAHSEKNATVAAYSHMELAADRKRALQFLADRVEALAAGSNVIPLRAA